MLNQLIEVNGLVVVGGICIRNDDFPVPVVIEIYTTCPIGMEVNPVQSLQYLVRRS